MADAKITSLGALSADPADTDVFVIVDVSDTSMAASGTDKKLAASYLMKSSGASAGATSQAQRFTNGVLSSTVRGGTASGDDITIEGSSHATKTSSYVIIQPNGGFVGIGTSTPAAPLQIVGTLGEIRASASLTDATQKGARFTVTHYTVAEEPLCGFIATSDVTENTVFYGGGSGSTNAATQLIFYAAANTTTTTGTAIMYIRSTGVFFGGTTAATAWADLAASTTSKASLRIRSGVAPSSPNAGDVWYTGSLLYRDGSASRTVATTDSAQALSNKTFTQINATSSAGLTLADDAGNLGIFIADGGKVTVRNEFVVESSAGKGLQVNPDFSGTCYFFAYDTPGTTHIPFIIRANTLDLQTGTAATTSRLTISATGEIRGNYDTDNAAFFGRARIGYDGSTTDWASFSHIDQTGGANFALMHTPAAATWLNAASGQNIYFAIGGSPKGLWDSSGNHTPYADNVSDSGISGKRWNDIWASNATIQTSDERDKVSIKPSSLGLGFIKALRPVSWVWADVDKPAITEKRQGPDGEYDHVIQPATKKTHKRPHYGFIAQQVKQAMDAVGVDDFAGYIYDQETDGYSLRYNEFMAPMVKALQELNERLERIEQTYYGD